MKFKILLQLYLSHSKEDFENLFLAQVKGKALLQYSIENLLTYFEANDIVAFAAEHYIENERFREILESFKIRYIPVKLGQITNSISGCIASLGVDYAIRVIGNNPFIDCAKIADCFQRLKKGMFDYVFFSGAPKGMTPSEILSGRSIRKAMVNIHFKQYLEQTQDKFIFSYFRKQTAVPTLVYDCQLGKYNYLDLSINKKSDLLNMSASLGCELDLERIARNRVAKIITANIEPSNQCNLDCQMCARITRKSFGMLSFSDFRKIVDKMEHLCHVNLDGDGEPFLNKELPEMLEYANQRGITTATNTNGTVPLPEERLVKILRNLNIFYISLDGASKRSFDIIRKNDNFEKTLENIRNISSLIKQNQLIFDEIGITCVIQEANHMEIKEMVCLISNLGFKAINFKLMNTNYDRGGRQLEDANLLVKERMMDHLYEDMTYISDQISQAEELGNRLGVQVYYEKDIGSNFSYHSCSLSQKAFITYDGWVTPCCFRLDPEVFNFGNILNQDYNSVFGSDRHRKFVHSLLKDEPPVLCLRCPALEIKNKRIHNR
jgi:MoaA/NifB/PqqE/SkfB family radical SAM enzyme/spore coat polysaccharide biosynthesis protein SpsF (cytidylyltransferase family)